MKSELGFLERQTLIEQLTHRFASLNGYKIEPDVQILDANNPRIKMWVAMAKVAIEEVEKQYEADADEE